MNILLTGGSGFLGRNIKETLFDHNIITLGRKNSDFNSDLSFSVPTLPEVDLVIHAAGRAHTLPKTRSETQAFYDVNVSGTRNLLKALENSSCLPMSFTFISTVAVYGLQAGRLISENNPLLATEPYGHSKIQAEQMVQEWCKVHGVICTVFRLPLIAGPNPPGNLASMVRGLRKGYYFNIAGGKAKKSIVLASDIARVIPKAAVIGGIYNLTDRYHPSFFELSKLISKQIHKTGPANIPFWFAKILSRMGDQFGENAPLTTKKLKKIVTDLTFDDSKAFKMLEWRPTAVLKGFNVE
jgi:nucleoside-diphosphate-sugar epimerase